MRLVFHANVIGEFGRGRVAAIHLRGDAMHLVVVKRQVQHRGDRFGYEPLSAMAWIEDPSDLTDAAFLVGEPQLGSNQGNPWWKSIRGKED